MDLPDRLGARVNNWLLLLFGGLALAAYYLLPVPFALIARDAPDWERYLIYGGIIVGATLGIVTPLLQVTRRMGIPFTEQFPLRRPGLAPALAVAAATLSLVPTLELITELTSRYFPPNQELLQFLTLLRPRGVLEFTVAGLALAVAVPLGEELLFRGLILRVLLRQSGPVMAVVLVGLLFASLHHIYSIPGVAVLGIYFGALAVLMGNLVYPILSHAVWNLANLALLAMEPIEMDGMTRTPFSDNPVLWLAVSLVLFSIFTRFALRFRHR